MPPPSTLSIRLPGTTHHIARDAAANTSSSLSLPAETSPSTSVQPAPHPVLYHHSPTMSYEHRGGERDDYYSSKRYDDSDDEDYKHAERRAAEHGSGDSSLFSQALGMLSGKKQSLKEEDLDEDDAVRQHKTYYGGGGHESSSQATEGNLGAAAAMQALKMFNSGEGKSSSKGEFLGLAMAQASKLFDEQSANGKTDPSASKQGAVQQAAQMALKMYLKSDQGGSSGGSKPSGLMGLASKFL
ncbi:hypothetical protein SLS56_000797 [Neofusicoccum ribis]|uniref:DUF7721 domain-containing protein n=1 Tax=Neofusicoccum ribis TaxID=45134 RepID=A0ABR3TD02_9PEZI